MSSSPVDGNMGFGPPSITPRSSSLQAALRDPNGKDIPAPRNADSDGESVNSESEKERVREKLKKTSIAGMSTHAAKDLETTEDATTECQSKGDDEPIAQSQQDQEMVGNDNKSELSDSSSASSRQSRKRSREADDDDEDLIAMDGRAHSRPRPHGRKRSRELSDEEAVKKEAHRQRDETKLQAVEAVRDGKNNDTQMLDGQVPKPPQALPSAPAQIASESTTIPEVQMKQSETVQSTSNHDPASPHRKGDGRKRIREEDNLDEEEEVKIKKPIIEEGDGVKKKIEEEDMSSAERKDLPKDSFQDVTENQNKAASTEAQSSRTNEGTSESKVPPGSGFTNTCAKSPFATTAAANAKPLFGAGATTSSLFANSKFGQMSGSTASPFKQVGASSSGSASPFAALGSGSKPSGLGPSPFASPPLKPISSPFGALAAKAPDILSSAPKTTAPIGGKPMKPFGAPGDDDDEGTDNEDTGGDDTYDDRYKILKNEFSQEKERITGEENEIAVCQYRAKLFYYDSASKSWKERGIGTVKLLSGRIDPNDIAEYGVAPDASAKMKLKLRLLMRADAVHKVILNVPMVAEALPTYGDEKGNPPCNNTFKLMGVENGKPQLFILKMKNNAEAKALHGHIVEHLTGAI